MTIGTTNVSMSSIATEKGIGESNLSLKTLSGKEVKLDTPAAESASSQYGLFTNTWPYGGHTDGRNDDDTVVVAAQGQGSAGLNTSSYGLGEWKGYDPQTHNRFGSNSYAVAFTSQYVISTGCFVFSRAGADIYCTKSGSTVTIYTTEPSGFGDQITYKGNGTSQSQSGTTTLGTLTAGTSQRVPTGCTMSTTIGTNTNTYGFLAGGQTATVSGGSTSTTNLGSTKIGYRLTCGGLSEAGPGVDSVATYRVGVRFNWTFADSPSGDAYEAAYTEVWIHLRATADHGSGFQSC